LDGTAGQTGRNDYIFGTEQFVIACYWSDLWCRPARFFCSALEVSSGVIEGFFWSVPQVRPEEMIIMV
jgi:hypothetical protein